MRPLSPTTVRVALVMIVPFVIIWTFFATLVPGIGDAFWYAWNAVQQELETFDRYWRGGWTEIQRDKGAE